MNNAVLYGVPTRDLGTVLYLCLNATVYLVEDGSMFSRASSQWHPAQINLDDNLVTISVKQFAKVDDGGICLIEDEDTQPTSDGAVCVLHNHASIAAQAIVEQRWAQRNVGVEFVVQPNSVDKLLEHFREFARTIAAAFACQLTSIVETFEATIGRIGLVSDAVNVFVVSVLDVPPPRRSYPTHSELHVHSRNRAYPSILPRQTQKMFLFRRAGLR